MTIQELAETIRAKVSRDVYGDKVIQGKRGNIHEDGKGFSVFVGMKTAAPLARCHEVVSKFAERRQNGDAEVVYFFNNATSDQINTLADFCRIRRKKKFSEETLAKMRERGAILAAKLKENRAK